MQIQEIIVKDFNSKKPKAKETKFAYAKVAKPLEQKDKKKKTRKYKQDIIKEWKKTLAISNNTIDTSKKNKYDVSNVTCFNCHRQSYYASIYTKLPKN